MGVSGYPRASTKASRSASSALEMSERASRSSLVRRSLPQSPSLATGGMVPGGWRFIPFLYAFLLLFMAALLGLLHHASIAKPGQSRPLKATFRPLKSMRVWRFSLYYVVVFGAYVAPRIVAAEVLRRRVRNAAGKRRSTSRSLHLPASLLRPVGGSLSDHLGARRVMYWSFGTMLVASGI